MKRARNEVQRAEGKPSVHGRSPFAGALEVIGFLDLASYLIAGLYFGGRFIIHLLKWHF